MAKEGAIFGTSYCGQRDFHPDGTFLTTLWFKTFGVPLIPLSTHRVHDLGEYDEGDVSIQTYRGVRVPLSWAQVIWTYLYILAFPGIPLITWMILLGLKAKPRTIETVLTWTVGITLGILIALPWILHREARRRAGLSADGKLTPTNQLREYRKSGGAEKKPAQSPPEQE